MKTAIDPEGDTVQYGWVLWDDQWNVKYVKDYAAGQTSIDVPASAGLQVGKTYIWTAVTFDGYAYSTWDPWYFTVQADPGIAGSNGVGLEDFYPYQDFPLGQATAFANMATGNLVVQDADLVIPGQGLNMRLVRTYNANDDGYTGVLGQGWRIGIMEGSAGSAGDIASIDLMQQVQTWWPTNTFDLVDVDGTSHHFVKKTGLLPPANDPANTPRSWDSPPGVNLVVTSWDNGVFELTRPDGVIYRFESFGSEGKYHLTKISDRKGNFLNFDYTTEQKPEVITDTVGRTITFQYVGATISKATFAGVGEHSGRTLVVEYQYENGRLKRVFRQPDTTAGAATAVYNYDAEGLSEVTDRRGNTTKFDLTGGASSRVTQITDRENKPWKLFYTGQDYTGGICNPQSPATAAVCLKDPENQVSVWSSNAKSNLLFRRDQGDTNGSARFNTDSYVWRADNRLQSQTDPAGNTTSYDYNPLGQISQSVATGSGDPTFTSIFEFRYPAGSAANGEMIKATTASGTAEARVWDFDYFANGTLKFSEDPLDKKTNFDYYDRGLLKIVTDPNLHTTVYGDGSADGGYDHSGQPKKITDAASEVAEFKYDFLGYQIEHKDREDKIWTSPVDLRGNVIETVTPIGDKTSFCYDRNDNQVALMQPRFGTRTCSPAPTAAADFLTVTSFDKRDLVDTVLSKSDGKVRKSVYGYFPDGQLQQITEPRSFSADGTAPSGTPQIARYERFPNNRISAFIDEEGHQTDVVYTAHGLLDKVTDPPGDAGRRHTMTYTYNRRGQVKTATEPGHAISPPSTLQTRYDYNLHGDMIKQTSPKGTFTTIEPDKMGRPRFITDARGKLTTRAYDNVGNLTSIEQPTDAGKPNTVTTYNYTARNEIDWEKDPADATHYIKYGYDGEGRQSARYDRRNNPNTGTTERTTTQSFRADGQITERRSTGTGLSEHRTVFDYDPDGNTKTINTFKDGATGTPNVSGIIATYTSAGELKTWDETITPPAGAAVTKSGAYSWNQDGTQDSNTVDGQTSNSTWTLDAREKTFTPYSNFGSFNSTYFANGALQQMLYPIHASFPTKSTTLTQHYDPADAVSSRVFTSATGTKISAWEGIGYDDNTNRTAETVTQVYPAVSPAPGGTFSGTGSYGYDELDRLTSFKHPFEATTTSYTLDDAGNVKTDSTAPSTTFGFTDNRLKTRASGLDSFTYTQDFFGNQTAENKLLSAPRTNTYNAALHPKRETLPDGKWVEYVYDGLERMVSRQDSTGDVKLFFHQGLDSQIALETSNTGAAKARYLVDAFRVARGKLDLGIGTTRSYYITDLRGNVTQMVQYTDHAVMATFGYDPYGKEKAALTKLTPSPTQGYKWDSRLRFQMAPQDPVTKSYNIGARLMNPTINRFVGADLYVGAAVNIGLQVDPLTGNRYLYAGANPAGLVDDGHRYRFFGWFGTSWGPMVMPETVSGRAPAPPRPVLSDDLKVKVGTAAAVAAIAQMTKEPDRDAVLLDTSALIAFNQAMAQRKPEEVRILTTKTAEKEFYEVTARKGMRGTLPSGVTVVDDTRNEFEYYRVLIKLLELTERRRGIQGDARIAATALDYDLPLITGDYAQATAVYTLGGEVRYIYDKP